MEGAWRVQDINLNIVKNITEVIIKKYWPLTNSDPSRAAKVYLARLKPQRRAEAC